MTESTESNQPTGQQIAADDIAVTVADGVCRITIDRPARKNALTRPNRLELIEAFEQAAERVDVRVVVLRGRGSAFCTGADLSVPPVPAPRPPDAPTRVAGEVARGIRTNAQRLITTVMDCDKPVIAAVNGVAAGMGVQLALACDLVIAADDARFIQVFARRGLVPDAGGAYLLSRLIGPQRAKELLFFGDTVSAAEAFAIGFVNRVVPAAELDAAVDDWATRLANGPTRALALCKQLVNQALEVGRDAALATEAMAQDLNMTTTDGTEGVRSFVEQRPTTFVGW